MLRKKNNNQNKTTNLPSEGDSKSPRKIIQKNQRKK